MYSNMVLLCVYVISCSNEQYIHTISHAWMYVGMQAYVVQYRHSLQKKRSMTFEDVEKVAQKDIDMLFLGAM